MLLEVKVLLRTIGHMKIAHAKEVRDFQQEIDGLQKTIAVYQSQEQAAVLQQFAIYVEAEIKLAFIGAMSQGNRAKYFNGPKPRMFQINKTSLETLEDVVRQEDPRAFRSLSRQLYADKSSFGEALYHLKKYSDDAHPIAFEGKPVVAETMTPLIETMDLRKMRLEDRQYSRKVEKVRREARRLVKVLADIRKKQARGTLLRNYT